MEIRYNEQGLVPAIAQDYVTGQVLMLAYMNKEAYDLTCQSKRAHYYSRSRQCLWEKGATSGHYQYVKSMSYDCDADTILLQVEQVGAACHTGTHSCFANTVFEDARSPFAVLEELYALIQERKDQPKEGSYTNFLLNKGISKIAKKVGEEGTEVVIAAMENDKEQITYETADLFYHLLVLLVQRGVTLEEVLQELIKRG